MKTLKVGDRVRVYDGHSKIDATVIEEFGERNVHALPDSVLVTNKTGETWHVHPRQCRRLVKKKPQEWDMAIPDNPIVRPIIGQVGAFETGQEVGDSRGPQWRIKEIIRVRKVSKQAIREMGNEKVGS